MKKLLLVWFAALMVAASAVFAAPSVKEVELAIQSGNVIYTQEALLEVIKEYPDSYKANFYMAQLMAAKGQWEESKKYSENADKLKVAHQLEADRIAKKIAEEKAKYNAEISEKNEKVFKMILGLICVLIIVGLFVFAAYKVYLSIQEKKRINEMIKREEAIKKEKETYFKNRLLEINSDLINIHFFAKAEKIDQQHILDIEEAKRLCADAIEAVFEDHHYYSCEIEDFIQSADALIKFMKYEYSL